MTPAGRLNSPDRLRPTGLHAKVLEAKELIASQGKVVEHRHAGEVDHTEDAPGERARVGVQLRQRLPRRLRWIGNSPQG